MDNIDVSSNSSNVEVAEKLTGTEDTSVQSKRRLTLKQKAFADKYTDIEDSKTFGNATQSVLATYPSIKTSTVAAVYGNKELNNGNVQDYISKVMQDKGIGIEHRSAKLAEYILAADPHAPTINRTYKDEDGKMINETHRPISPTAFARLLDIANRTEGLYNKARVAERLAVREYDKLREGILGKMRERQERG